jgi:mRNA-degrading endonuclease RelE of RelBE toxin-antitoxin system
MGNNITIVKYEVRVKKKIARGLAKLPRDVQQLFFLLVTDLQDEGPIQKTWPNFSALGDETYHCHLNYRYVACWSCRKGEITIEVYYAGSREKAPY